MLQDYYINQFVTYTKSGSITSDGTYIYSGSAHLSGSCRMEPLTDNEGDATHRIFMNVVSLDHVDTIWVDGEPYEVRAIKNYFNHHLEVEVFNV